MNLSAEKAFVTPAGAWVRGWGSSISEEVPRDGPDTSGRRVPPVRKGLSVERWGETALSLFSISYLTVKQARLAGGRPRRVMAFM